MPSGADALVVVDALQAQGVRIVLTTRAGGVSGGGYATFNLAEHVGDDPAAVAANRARLRAWLRAEPLWLRQVHGTTIVDADALRVLVPVARSFPDAEAARRWLDPKVGADSPITSLFPVAHAPSHRAARVASALSAPFPTEADGATSQTPGQWLALLTADCLPVVLVATDGSRLTVAHAGWRGVAAGMLDAAARSFAGGAFAAWIGPAIGACCYEVDAPVVEALQRRYPQLSPAFLRPSRPNHWRLDLAGLAQAVLLAAGATSVVRMTTCTACDCRWYSHRREGPHTGRFATLAVLLQRNAVS